jgi:hypothetical protein
VPVAAAEQEASSALPLVAAIRSLVALIPFGSAAVSSYRLLLPGHSDHPARASLSVAEW